MSPAVAAARLRIAKAYAKAATEMDAYPDLLTEHNWIVFMAALDGLVSTMERRVREEKINDKQTEESRKAA